MTSALLLRFVGCGLVALACLLTIIATAGNYWIQIQYLGYDVHSGLWKSCAADICVDTPKENWLQATRAFMVMACIGYAAALAIGVLLFVKRDLSSLIMAAPAFFAAIFVLIGMAVYRSKVAAGYYAWSFYLGWAGLVVGGLGSSILLIGSRYQQIS